MKYLVLADVHSNLEALQAVLSEAKKSQYRRLLCLGDLVGYCADPNKVLGILRQQEEAILLMGNHDAAAAGLIGLEKFNPGAAACLKWTVKKLTPDNKAFLAGLPKFFSNEFMLALHGSPKDYLWGFMNTEAAKESLKVCSERLIMVGHTHEAFYYREGDQAASMVPENEIVGFAEKRLVVSMPSVGQPRDENTKTGFAFIDFEKQQVEIKRVEYDFRKTAAKILEAGLPRFQAERLALGR